MKQLALALPEWGGARRGAGRKRKHPLPELDGKPGVPHRVRPPIATCHPVHVTLRLRSGIGNARTPRRSRVLERSFADAQLRFGLRIVHWSIQGNHLHLIVEVDGRDSLSRGMQGLSIRIARRLNALIGRRGPVFVDRYHAHVLKTRREAANAVRYVVKNFFLHRGVRDETAADPRSSEWFEGAPPEYVVAVKPRTWLLRLE